jgi:hypothetical protein
MHSRTQPPSTNWFCEYRARPRNLLTPAGTGCRADSGSSSFKASVERPRSIIRRSWLRLGGEPVGVVPVEVLGASGVCITDPGCAGLCARNSGRDSTTSTRIKRSRTILCRRCIEDSGLSVNGTEEGSRSSPLWEKQSRQNSTFRESCNWRGGTVLSLPGPELIVPSTPLGEPQLM